LGKNSVPTKTVKSLHFTAGVSNSNWLGGRIWPIFEMAGRIRPMSWVGGPQKSSRKALRVLLTIIFFTFIRYLFISSKIVQERLQKIVFLSYLKLNLTSESWSRAACGPRI
jgi:hypothetical protein